MSHPVDIPLKTGAVLRVEPIAPHAFRIDQPLSAQDWFYHETGRAARLSVPEAPSRSRVISVSL